MLENNENESIIKEEINESKNKNNISFNNNKETIILILIDKIISNVIHEANKNQIYNNLGLFCYDKVKNQLNHLLKTKFFFHDNIQDENKGKIFWDYKPEKFDNWVFFKEPKNPDKDRNNSNMVKIVTYKNIDSVKTIKFKKNDALTELIELENNISQNKLSITKRTLKIKNIFNKNKMRNKILNMNKKENSKKKTTIMDLTSTDLEKEKYFNIYSEMNNNEEYNILRKEKEESISKKEKERKIIEAKKLFSEKTIKKLEANKNKKLPNINGKEFTFDPNGQIMKKNLININKLKKEFMPVKSKKNENNNIIVNEMIMNKIDISLNNTNKNIIDKNNNDKNLNSNLSNDENKKNEIKYKKLNINQLKINKNKKGNIIKNKKFLIEYNPKDKLTPDDYPTKYIKSVDNKPITPSGSNLDIINPVTGVVLKYNNRYKRDGGFNYFKKYNKPSMEDFNKLALSYSPAEMQEILLFPNNIDNMNNITNNKIKEKNNKISYNGYKEKFDDNNPLIKNAHILSPQKNSKSISVKILKNLNINNKNKLLLNEDSKIKQLNIDENNIIQLSKSINNLYNFFSEDNNNVFPEYTNNSQINHTSNNIVNENILNKKLINYKLPIIKKKEIEINKIMNDNEKKDKMSKFNLDIIKDIKGHNWGNDLINTPNDKSFNYHKRPILFSPKRFNIHKIEKIRERKNILDKINNSEQINYEKILVKNYK